MNLKTSELNTCYYSPGNDKHSCCTHPRYCIFNPNRIRLDNNIHELETELQQRINDLNFIKNEGTRNSTDYNTTRNRIKYLNKDLKKLKDFRINIIKKEMKAYGYLEK